MPIALPGTPIGYEASPDPEGDTGAVGVKPPE